VLVGLKTWLVRQRIKTLYTGIEIPSGSIAVAKEKHVAAGLLVGHLYNAAF